MKVKKVLIIGSGPIVIGQAAEFDYSGTQACLSAREEGVKTVLVNSNPATIQTDHEVSDIVYIEPLTCDFLEKIIAKERPDGLIATVGGQTALNLAVELFEKGILAKYGTSLLGTDIEAITRAEDRGKFADLMKKIGQPVPESKLISSEKEALSFARKVGFPLIVRGAFNLGGTGSGIAYDKHDLQNLIMEAFVTNSKYQVLIEKSALGWGEIEYEIVRDNAGNKISICNMENLDPTGVHTGESIVVAPSQTLSDQDYQMLRTASFEVVEALGIAGACNIQFAINQKTGEYFVIEVNPRLSRSSALASKATGYPIARIATKIALGKTLVEIINPITGKTAFFEPALDYVVVKIPKWPDEKFFDMDMRIGITMKSTGEAMAIGRSFEEALYKAIESLDSKVKILEGTNVDIRVPRTKRLSGIFYNLKKGKDVTTISQKSGMSPWFIKKMKNLLDKMDEIQKSINVYKMVDTCAGEFEALTPYFYSTHGTENEALSLPGPKVIILGSGPIKIGQGIEFDYLTVHAVLALREMGIKAIVINNNPETVSTDFSISDRLYFEPLTSEFVLKVIENEKEGLLGVIPQFGGQTAINLVEGLKKAGVKILGTQKEGIENAEDREKTANIISKLGYKMPGWKIAHNKTELLNSAKKLGFPVLVRPSYVLAGEGMIIAKSERDLENYFLISGKDIFNKPVLIDKFLENALEIDVDFVSDGKRTVSFILEQLDLAGIHSGDSSCVYPPQKMKPPLLKKITKMVDVISKAFKIIGIANIQCAIVGDEVYILEINPRGSRTIPFISKCIGFSLSKLATKLIMGEKIVKKEFQKNGLVSIKTPIFSFLKLPGVSSSLGPLMKSTGEKMSVGATFEEAWGKAQDLQVVNKKTKIYSL